MKFAMVFLSTNKLPKKPPAGRAVQGENPTPAEVIWVFHVGISMEFLLPGDFRENG